MANPISVTNEVHKLAKAHLLAKSAFNRAYCRFWREVKPCPDVTGWKLLEMFRRIVEEHHFKLGRNELGIKQAAWEIFRLELVGQSDYRYEDALGFVKWYEVLKRRIECAIGHLYDYHGDSFSDLVDAYPLAGRELVERALATHPESTRPRREGYLDESEVGDAVMDKLGIQWHRLICNGANYILPALDAACYKCFLHRILTGLDEQVVWAEDETDALDFACHYDR